MVPTSWFEERNVTTLLAEDRPVLLVCMGRRVLPATGVKVERWLDLETGSTRAWTYKGPKDRMGGTIGGVYVGVVTPDGAIYSKGEKAPAFVCRAGEPLPSGWLYPDAMASYRETDWSGEVLRWQAQDRAAWAEEGREKAERKLKDDGPLDEALDQLATGYSQTPGPQRAAYLAAVIARITGARS